MGQHAPAGGKIRRFLLAQGLLAQSRHTG
jgi:hypothetical protein